MRIIKAVILVAAGFFLVTGTWALAAPRSFYDVLATYPPFNEHLFHDLGAFQVGLGAMALAGTAWRDGLSVALAGVAVASVLHAGSHIVDADHGGRPSDPWALSLLALVVTAALVAHVRRRSS